MTEKTSWCEDCNEYNPQRPGKHCGCGNKLAPVGYKGQVKCRSCNEKVHPRNAEYFYIFGNWECDDCVNEELEKSGIDVNDLPSADELGLNVAKNQARKDKKESQK